MPDPIVHWYDHLKAQGFTESAHLVTVAQRLSLTYKEAADFAGILSEAGVANPDDPIVKAMRAAHDRVLEYVQAEADCARQLMMIEIKGHSAAGA